MNKVSKTIPVVWPVHPSTLAKLKFQKIEIPSSILITKPLSYFRLASLLRFAKVIFTDSGGIQKEAYFHKTPCVTLRMRLNGLKQLIMVGIHLRERMRQQF